MKNIFLIILLSLIFNFVFSNIWDNIYTQVNSPHFTIDDNFQIILENVIENTTAAELLFSSELGLIKFSFILSESNNNDSFIQIIIDFNNGKLYFDTEEKCLYKYMDLIKQLSPKFIINAYDILSYFSEDNDYYRYIVTNPLEITGLEKNVFLLAENIMIDFGNNFKEYKSIYDKDLYAEFIVDKNEEMIKHLKIKTSYGLLDFKTVFKAYNITEDKFFGIHDFFNCTEYN